MPFPEQALMDLLAPLNTNKLHAFCPNFSKHGKEDLDDGQINRVATALSQSLNVNSIKLTHLRKKTAVELIKAIVKLMVHKQCNLTSLVINYSDLDDEDMFALSIGIAENSSLIDLDLQHNNIGDWGAKVLAASIKKKQKMQTVDLSYNKIGAEGKRMFSRKQDNPSDIIKSLKSVRFLKNGDGKVPAVQPTAELITKITQQYPELAPGYTSQLQSLGASLQMVQASLSGLIAGAVDSATPIIASVAASVTSTVNEWGSAAITSCRSGVPVKELVAATRAQRGLAWIAAEEGGDRLILEELATTQKADQQSCAEAEAEAKEACEKQDGKAAEGADGVWIAVTRPHNVAFPQRAGWPYLQSPHPTSASPSQPISTAYAGPYYAPCAVTGAHKSPMGDQEPAIPAVTFHYPSVMGQYAAAPDLRTESPASEEDQFSDPGVDTEAGAVTEFAADSQAGAEAEYAEDAQTEAAEFTEDPQAMRESQISMSSSAGEDSLAAALSSATLRVSRLTKRG